MTRSFILFRRNGLGTLLRMRVNAGISRNVWRSMSTDSSVVSELLEYMKETKHAESTTVNDTSSSIYQNDGFPVIKRTTTAITPLKDIVIEHGQSANHGRLFERDNLASVSTVNLRKHSKLVEELELHTKSSDIEGINATIQKMSTNETITQVDTTLMGSVFQRMLNGANPSVLQAFLNTLYAKDIRLPTADHYVQWIRYHIRVSQWYRGICVYENYRVRAELHNSVDAIVAMVDAFIANEQVQITIDRKYGFGHQRCRVLCYDIIQRCSPLLNEALNQFLISLCTRAMPDKLALYQTALSKGYTVYMETQRELFRNLYIDRDTEIEPILALYWSIRQSGSTPDPNTTFHLMHLLLTKQQTSASSSALEKPEDIALNIFNDVYANGGTFSVRIAVYLIMKLSKLNRLADVKLVYNKVKSNHPDSNHILELDCGYAKTLLHTGNVEEAQAMLETMMTYTFHEQIDGRYIGPNGEMLVDSSTSERLINVHNRQFELIASFNERFIKKSAMQEVLTTEELLVNAIRELELRHSDYSVTRDDSKLSFIRPSDVKHDYVADVQSKTIDILPITMLAGELITKYRVDANITAAYALYNRLRDLGYINHSLVGVMQWVPFYQKDWAGVLHLLDDMRSFKIPLTTVLLTAFIKSYVHLQEPFKAEGLLLAYLSTRNHVKHLEDTRWLSPEKLCLRIVSCYIETKQSANAAQFILRCHERHLDISAKTTKMLLDEAILRGSVDDTVALLDFIKQNGLKMSAAAYSRVMSFMAKQGRLPIVLAYYAEADAHNLQGNPYLITSVLQAYMRARQHTNGWQFFLEARQRHQFCLNAVSLSVMLSIVTYMKSIKIVDELLRLAQIDGVSFNERHWLMLEKAYRYHGAYDQSLNVLLDRMPQAGFTPPYDILQRVDDKLKSRGLTAMQCKLQQAIRNWYPNYQQQQQQH
ncbi:hypothetical protein BDF22DRAFT_691967 [Syncephalis plumigaleata]|nr:hypothetical protein BDF22DRAFT_691967 [Syncephalis plumigaleata]